MELVPLDKDFPAKSQGVQLLKMMEFITFSTSLTSPLLGIAVTVNYSHLSNGVKSLHLSRSHFETLIQAVGSMSYSPDAMVLQIQANKFFPLFFFKMYILKPQGAYDNAYARTQDLEAALGSNYYTQDNFAVSVEAVTSGTLTIMEKISTLHESLVLIR